MSKEIETMPDDVLYHVCTRVLRKKVSLKATTLWLKANGYPTAKRTWPHKMLLEAFDRGLDVDAAFSEVYGTSPEEIDVRFAAFVEGVGGMDVIPLPEPAALLQLGCGALTLLVLRRRAR